MHISVEVFGISLGDINEIVPPVFRIFVYIEYDRVHFLDGSRAG